MTKLPTWKTIASDLDAQCSYLMRRCLVAEGKDPSDDEAALAIVSDMEEAARL